MSLEQRSQLPTTPCCYFAIDALEQVQYIGRSTDLRQRWLQHHRYYQLSNIGNIKIAWLEVSEPRLLPEIEKALIEWFQPPLNHSSIFTGEGENSASVSAIISKEQCSDSKRPTSLSKPAASNRY